MLTLYSARSSFLKKSTVIVVWLIALFFSIYLVRFVTSDSLSWGIKILPTIIGIFMIAGILLRCKIARGFTILTLYMMAIYPLVFNAVLSWVYPDMSHSSMFTYSLMEGEMFSSMETFLTNLFWAALFIFPLYFLSNRDAMEIFYIDSYPMEHLFYLFVAIFLSATYTYYASADFIEVLKQHAGV